MIDIALAVAVTICVIGAVAPIAIGMYALRNIVTEVTTLVADLPTRLVEDSSTAREANRRRAFWETVTLLAVRSLPGIVVSLCGMILLAWVLVRIVGLITLKGL
jgi:hypothetical protein